MGRLQTPMVEGHLAFPIPMLLGSCKLMIMNNRCIVTPCMHNFLIRRFKQMVILFRRWLDKLGLAAIFNHTRVMRQDFAGYNYGLVEKDDGTPLPVRLSH